MSCSQEHLPAESQDPATSGVHQQRLTPFTEVPEALEYITQELGYSQAPVIVNNSDDQDHWSGLRPDKLVHAAMTHTTASRKEA
ncbi:MULTISPECIES: hypothetical protein [unclassified Paenarthrobacter]|uniref:hypothetical protein n=1 Tax=unclassified Paenarthrobacter TaxID=2634190 RepID=UPI002555555C|nr:hypothetical protein [Paenarthrobacter sp. R1]WIV29303.1 hypothetical protein QN084_13110 [Paenarthrobacter sp. R1]